MDPCQLNQDRDIGVVHVKHSQQWYSARLISYSDNNFNDLIYVYVYYYWIWSKLRIIWMCSYLWHWCFIFAVTLYCVGICHILPLIITLWAALLSLKLSFDFSITFSTIGSNRDTQLNRSDRSFNPMQMDFLVLSIGSPFAHYLHSKSFTWFNAE